MALTTSDVIAIGAPVLTLGALGMVGSVRLAWRSLTRQIGEVKTEAAGALGQITRDIATDRLVLINHGERIAYLEGLQHLPRGSLGRPAPDDRGLGIMPGSEQ